MYDGLPAVAEYFHVNKIDWPTVVAHFVAYAVVAVAVAVLDDAAAAAAVAVASAYFDIDQLDTYDTD